MVTLQSEPIQIYKPIREVFEYCININSFKSVFNRITKDWTNTEDTLQFRLAIILMDQISFEFKLEHNNQNRIKLESYGTSFADCSILVNFSEHSEFTDIQFIFETPESTFQDPNCPTKPAIVRMLQIFSENLKSQFV
jgi:hypothetical protein